MSYSRFERVYLYLIVLVMVVADVVMILWAASMRPLDEVSRKWRKAAEDCAYRLVRVCEKEREVQRKNVGLRECQLLYEDFVLSGAYECRDGKLYADIWVGGLYYSVKDKEVVWRWEE